MFQEILQGGSGGGDKEPVFESFEVATSQSITIPKGIRYVIIISKIYAMNEIDIYKARPSLNGIIIDKWDLYTRGDLSYPGSANFMNQTKLLKVKEGDVITFNSDLPYNETWASYNIIYYS